MTIWSLLGIWIIGNVTIGPLLTWAFFYVARNARDDIFPE